MNLRLWTRGYSGEMKYGLLREMKRITANLSLDRFKERYDKKLSKAYLEGRYGAIPVFNRFDFGKGV